MHRLLLGEQATLNRQKPSPRIGKNVAKKAGRKSGMLAIPLAKRSWLLICLLNWLLWPRTLLKTFTVVFDLKIPRHTRPSPVSRKGANQSHAGRRLFPSFL